MAGDSVKMQVLMDHYNCLQLTLEECHAVTPNGIRIQISASQEGQTLTLSKDMTEMKGNATFSVFITAELFKPTPYGEAATQEYPPRIPFLRPTLMLNQVRPQILFLIHSINILQRNEKYKEKF